MLKRLRLKFVLINMIIVFVMLGTIFGTIFHFTQKNLEAESVSMMQTIAARPFKPGNPNEPPDGIRLPYFKVEISPSGVISASGGGYYDLSDEDFLNELVKAADQSRQRTGLIRAYNLRYFRLITPVARCIVFADTTSEQATLHHLAQTFGLIGTASFIVFLGISLLLARWAVKPVDQAWKQQKQFVANASHELKTPLTVIMTNAELLQSPEYDEATRAQFSDSILIMSRQMRSLVEQLLELARIDNGQVKPVLTTVDFSSTVENALLPFDPLFFERNLTLSSQIEENITLRGNEGQLRQMLEILLDNARKYSAPGQVEVSLTRQERGRCLLWVSNPGEPISSEDLKNIFKRFYRIDKARSRTGSFGLGLSIAQSIVLQHHGRIWAESRDGKNQFLVEFSTQQP